MLNTNIMQADESDKNRIKMRLRSYVKDTSLIDDEMLQRARDELRELSLAHHDPVTSVSLRLVLTAYRAKQIQYKDLTEIGCKLIKFSE